MVGIVIVSHSASLAEGVRELADQMVQGQVPLATAGGIDDPDQPIGTDPMKVLAAIESVYGDDGVLVLMDLGSAGIFRRRKTTECQVVCFTVGGRHDGCCGAVHGWRQFGPGYG